MVAAPNAVRGTDPRRSPRWRLRAFAHAPWGALAIVLARRLALGTAERRDEAALIRVDRRVGVCEGWCGCYFTKVSVTRSVDSP
jgi:hypothetical protein